MSAWLFGVILTLYSVKVVVAVMFVLKLISGVSVAGFVTEPYTVPPPAFVISTRLNPPDVPAAKLTVTAVTVSSPLDV
jgi:hypothetical protein